MDLKSWRATCQEKLTLPSGLEVTAKKVGMLDLAGQGDIPAPLLGLAQMVIEGTVGEPVKFDMKQLPDFVGMVNAVCRVAIIDPPLADDEKLKEDEVPEKRADYLDSHLRLDEIPINDRFFVFNWCNAEAQAMEPFRQEPAPNGNDRHAGEQVQPAPKQPVGNIG